MVYLPVLSDFAKSNAGRSIETFFGEWQDGVKVWAFHYAYGFLSLLGIFIVALALPQASTTALIYAVMLLTVGFIATPERFNERAGWLGVNKFGLTFNNMFIALAAGVGFSLFATGALLPTIALPYQAIVFSFNLAAGFIFVVFIAPDVEEQLFRATVTPTSGKLFATLGLPMPMLLGAMLSIVSFAIFHIGVLQGKPLTIDFLVPYMIFATVAELGNHAFKSYGFGLGAHYVSNFIIWSRLHPTLF